MEIDRRVRANDFMKLLSVGKTKFYRMLKQGELPEPIRLSEKDVFWHESQVKKEVEKYKQESDNIACTQQALYFVPDLSKVFKTGNVTGNKNL